jgi:anthranilate phosphoribosyltransferase
MDELSITGATTILDFDAGRGIRRFSLRPEDAGLKAAVYAEIAPLDTLAAECRRFVRVLTGCGSAACRDFVCLNAAAVLLVAGTVEDLREGIRLSRQAIENGTALRKLRAWVGAQNTVPEAGAARLEKVLAEAGVENC